MKYIGQNTFDHGESADNRAPRIGILLSNLGTPDSCTPREVRRYLREFLWDPRMVELPRPVWWFILNALILTTRPRKTAKAYGKVWRDDGSPLLIFSQQQRQKIQQRMLREHPGSNIVAIELGMRYGNPSIATALENMRQAGARKLLVLPLYPQYCASTTASTFDAVFAELSRWRWMPALRTITHYHDQPAYIAALASSVHQYRLANGDSEVLLMSFHSTPLTNLAAGDPYHCECHKTARLVAEELELSDTEWRVSFQSRVGLGKWLQPYTAQTLKTLAQSGLRDVQVLCPGFSVDCLETLEEIASEGRSIFMRAGGERYGYIPCLNHSEKHIEFLTALIGDHLRDWNTPATDRGSQQGSQQERARTMGAKS